MPMTVGQGRRETASQRRTMVRRKAAPFKSERVASKRSEDYQNAGSTAPSYFLLMKSLTCWLVNALESFSIASV